MVSTSKHSKVGRGCCSHKYSKIPEAEKRGLYYLLLGQNKYCLLNAGWWWCAGRRGPERKCAGPDRILWMEGGQPGHARGRPALVHCTMYIVHTISQYLRGKGKMSSDLFGTFYPKFCVKYNWWNIKYIEKDFEAPYTRLYTVCVSVAVLHVLPTIVYSTN